MGRRGIETLTPNRSPSPLRCGMSVTVVDQQSRLQPRWRPEWSEERFVGRLCRARAIVDGRVWLRPLWRSVIDRSLTAPGHGWARC